MCGTVARRARRRACRLRAACGCVREAAHVRLGATMASELAEKRSAIAWMGWVERARDVKGHFAEHG